MNFLLNFINVLTCVKTAQGCSNARRVVHCAPAQRSRSRKRLDERVTEITHPQGYELLCSVDRTTVR